MSLNAKLSTLNPKLKKKNTIITKIALLLRDESLDKFHNKVMSLNYQL